ncbi:MAG: dihydroneopterin aldolase [Maricaulaceae bacterium]
MIDRSEKRGEVRPLPAPVSGETTVFVRGLRVDASIGVHPHEHETVQPILIDIAVDLGAYPGPKEDRLAEVLDYQTLADKAETFARAGHVQLVETLAERIAAWCLRDSRAVEVRVRIEKPQALGAAAAAGVEIVRRRG